MVIRMVAMSTSVKIAMSTYFSQKVAIVEYVQVAAKDTQTNGLIA